MSETAETTLDEKMEEMKKSDPLYHDLILAFSQYSKAAQMQSQAIGVIIDLIAMSRSQEKNSDK